MTEVKHYLVLDDQERGPYTFAQLQGMWRNGAVTSATMHFMDGYTEWMPLEILVPDLDPPPLRHYAASAMPRPLLIAKSRGIYILLALFFLGLLGAHNFYAGRYGSAVAQLLITLFIGWLILPLLAVALWIILECFLVTKDGDGNRLS